MGESCHTTGLTWEVSWKKKEKEINKGTEKGAQRYGRHKSLWTRVVEDKEIEKVRQRERKKKRDRKREKEKKRVRKNQEVDKAYLLKENIENA